MPCCLTGASPGNQRRYSWQRRTYVAVSAKSGLVAGAGSPGLRLVLVCLSAMLHQRTGVRWRGLRVHVSGGRERQIKEGTYGPGNAAGRRPSPTGLADVTETILDKGLVIDATNTPGCV